MALSEFLVSTSAREIFVDITSSVQQALERPGCPQEGVAVVFIPHTTAGVTINEGADPAVVRDLLDILARLAPRQGGYRHAEGNSDAHFKASLLGSQVVVPVADGRLRLGTWQAIYLAEFDGPRTRKVWVTPLAAPEALLAPESPGNPAGPAVPREY